MPKGMKIEKLLKTIIVELEKEKIEGGLLQKLEDEEYRANPVVVNIAVEGCIKRVKKVFKKII